MNRKLALALVAATLAAGTAFADTGAAEGSSYAFAPFTSVKSRTEVKAELAEYQRDNAWPMLPYGYDDRQADFHGTLTRAEVKAELADFQRTHPWPLQGEVLADYSGSAAPTAQVAGQPVNGQ